MKIFIRITASLTALLGSFLLPPALAQAQVPTFDRAVACGSGEEDWYWGVHETVTDAQGNTYVVGTFSGTTVLGSTILTAPGTSPGPSLPTPGNVFVAKLNAAGNYSWAVQLNIASLDVKTHLAVDAAGDVYVAGAFDTFRLDFGLGGIVLFNSGRGAEAYVAKLSGSTGQWQWARRCGGTGYDTIGGIRVDATGQVSITGTCGGNSDFGPVTLTPAATAGNHLFAAKLDATGAWQWAQAVGSGDWLTLKKTVFDVQGNMYLAGEITQRGTNVIGTTTLTTQRPPNSYSSGYDIFVAKLTPTGTVAWATQTNPGGDNQNYMGDIACDDSGHLYVVGYYAWRSARFGTTVLTNGTSPIPYAGGPGTIGYSGYPYVARLNASTGAWEWAFQTPTTADNIDRVAADAQGRVYVASSSQRFGFTTPLTGATKVDLAQLDGATGTWRWARPQVATVALHRLGLDGMGRILTAGWFTGPSATFGATVLTQAGPGLQTGYVARMAAGPLASHSVAPAPATLAVWPNPSGRGAVWVQGVAVGKPVEVFDVLGRSVGGGTMPVSGPLRLELPATLPTGIYLVRGQGQVARLLVD